MRVWESDHEEEPPPSEEEADDDEGDEETKELKKAKEIALSMFNLLSYSPIYLDCDYNCIIITDTSYKKHAALINFL